MSNNPEQSPRVTITARRTHEGTAIETSLEAVAERLLRKPVTIHIYTDGVEKEFSAAELSEYLTETFGQNFTVNYHGELLENVTNEEMTTAYTLLAEASFARKSIYLGRYDAISIEERIAFEKFTGTQHETSFRDVARSYISAGEAPGNRFSLRTVEIIDRDYYDLTKLMAAYRQVIPAQQLDQTGDIRHMTLVFTGRGIGDLEGGQKIHMRAGTASGSIGIISTTGLVDAPAKPEIYTDAILPGFGLLDLRERDEGVFNEVKQVIKIQGFNGDIMREALSAALESKMLHHHDSRITSASRGLALTMALFALGEVAGGIASCSTTNLYDPKPNLELTCRLHDAHQQEELVHAQIDADHAEFCAMHSQLFQHLQQFVPQA